MMPSLKTFSLNTATRLVQNDLLDESTKQLDYEKIQPNILMEIMQKISKNILNPAAIDVNQAVKLLETCKYQEDLTLSYLFSQDKIFQILKEKEIFFNCKTLKIEPVETISSRDEIPFSIFPNLRDFSLYHWNLSESSFQNLIQKKTLTYLCLNYVQLTGEHLQTLVKTLQKNSPIKGLELCFNGIKKDDWNTFFLTAKLSPSLESLKIETNGADASTVAAFVTFLKNHPSLKEITLTLSLISAVSFQSLIPYLQEISTPLTLDLSENSIDEVSEDSLKSINNNNLSIKIKS